MTDCFQPAERFTRVTYETIKALNKRGVHYLIVTKSSLVTEYMDIMDKRLAHIQITVTTTDDKQSYKYESAVPASERIAAIQTLQNGGFDVALRLSPFIPELVDLDKFAALGIKKVLVEFLRVNSWIKKWMQLDFSEYTVKHGGYRHLPLEKKIEYIKKIRGFEQISVCEDEDEAYLYWKENVNHNREDCCNLSIEEARP